MDSFGMKIQILNTTKPKLKIEDNHLILLLQSQTEGQPNSPNEIRTESDFF